MISNISHHCSLMSMIDQGKLQSHRLILDSLHHAPWLFIMQAYIELIDIEIQVYRYRYRYIHRVAEIGPDPVVGLHKAPRPSPGPSLFTTFISPIKFIFLIFSYVILGPDCIPNELPTRRPLTKPWRGRTTKDGRERTEGVAPVGLLHTQH